MLDSGVKVLVRNSGNLEVLAEIALQYTLSLGNCIAALQWDHNGESLAVWSTDGSLWSYSIFDRPPDQR